MGTSLCKKKLYNFCILSCQVQATCTGGHKRKCQSVISCEKIQWILLAGSVVAFTLSFSWCQNLIKNLCLHSNKTAKFSGRVLTVSVDLNK